MLVHTFAQGLLGLSNIAFLTVLAPTPHSIYNISSFLLGYPILNPYEFLSQGVPRLVAGRDAMGLKCIFDLFRNSCNVRESDVRSHRPPVPPFIPLRAISTPSIPDARRLESPFWVTTIAQRSFNVCFSFFLLICFTDDCVGSVAECGVLMTPSL